MPLCTAVCSMRLFLPQVTRQIWKYFSSLWCRLLQQFPHWRWECLLRHSGGRNPRNVLCPQVELLESITAPRCAGTDSRTQTPPVLLPRKSWQWKGTPWASHGQPALMEAVRSNTKSNRDSQPHGESSLRTKTPALASIYNIFQFFLQISSAFSPFPVELLPICSIFFPPLNIKDKSQITLQGCQSSCLKIKSYPIPMWTRVFPETPADTV